MKRNFLGCICYLLAVATLVLSCIPLLQLNYTIKHGHLHRRGALDYGMLEMSSWDYSTIHAWLILFAGLAGGLCLFWLGNRIRSKKKVAGNIDVPVFSIKRIGVIIGIMIGALLGLAFLPGWFDYFGKSTFDYQTSLKIPPASPASNSVYVVMRTNVAVRIGVRVRASDFSPEEKVAFQADFTTKYQPAVSNWCHAFQGRLPFSPDNLTAGNLVERIGQGKSFIVYTFVLDGTTVCVRDENGSAQVFYLNAPQAKQLMGLPKGTAPTAATPVAANEVAQMLKADSGKDFNESDIHITPSGYSSALNGGAYVNIGGDPDNAATWEYTLVFGPDGKLAYYLKANR